MSEYRYTSNIGLPGITANLLINKEFGLNLKHEYDSYKCKDYEIILDGDMAYIYFKEFHISFIKETMNKISYALGYNDKWDALKLMPNENNENYMQIHNLIDYDFEKVWQEANDSYIEEEYDSDKFEEKEK